MLTSAEKQAIPLKGTQIYTAIAGELRSRIANGEWQPGRQIAPEKELAKKFNVCRATLKKSLEVLEAEGLLWSRRGKGRFVTDTRTRNKTWVAGLVLFEQENLANPVTSRRFAGIQKVLGEAGYHLKTVAINNTVRPALRDARTSLVAMLDPKGIDGAIVLAEQLDRLQVERLAEYTPVVWLNHPIVSPRLLGVQEDHIGGAFAATKHLLELGHRRIALLTAAESFGITHAQRDGVRLAMREVTAENKGELAVLCGSGNFTIEAGRELAQRLLDMPALPTAVICGSDEVAIGAFEVLSKAGLKVPNDISMIAWNDTLSAEQIPLPMTTVRLDFSRSAAAGAQMLLRMMENPGVPVQQGEAIEAELIIRKSTASPREE